MAMSVRRSADAAPDSHSCREITSGAKSCAPTSFHQNTSLDCIPLFALGGISVQ